MTARYEQPGDSIEITAPVGGTTRGTPVVINGRILGMPALSVLATASVNVKVAGVFEVTKLNAQAWVEGEPIYWDNTNSRFTSEPAGLFAGVATKVAANPSTTGYILMNQAGQEAGFHIGTAAVPIVDDSGANHMEGYFDCGAVAGWPAGLFLQVAVTGVGGSFTCLQGDPVVSAEKQVVTGVESYTQFTGAGCVTGACRAGQFTINFSNAALAGGGGVYSALRGNITGSGAATDVTTAAPQRISCLELGVEGVFAAGQGFEDGANSYAIYFNGLLAGAGNILNNTNLTIGAGDPANVIGIRVGVGADAAAGDVYYIPLVPAAEWN